MTDRSQTTKAVLARLMRDVYGHGPEVSAADAVDFVDRLHRAGYTIVANDTLAATRTAADFDPLIDAYAEMTGQLPTITSFLAAAEGIVRTELARREKVVDRG